jgi:hypothetical protein
MNKKKDLTLEEQIGEDDWAIIIGNNGNLKGIFIPQGMDEELVPESIVQIMAQYFGVDFEEEIDEAVEVPPGETLH